MSPAYTIPSIFTAVDRFSGPVRRMATATNAFVRSSEIGLARVERGYRSIMSPLYKLNRMLMGLGVYVGLYTLIRIFENFVKTISDFEYAQKQISAVTHRSVQENKAYANQARELALRWGDAATSVSELQLELEKLGGLDVLKLTEPILVGATALELMPKKYGELVGAMVKAFPELKAEGAVEKLVGQMVFLADETAVAGDDFFTFLSNSMAAAVAAKRPYTEILTIMGMLKNEAIQMASGGTATKNILIDSEILKGGRKSWQELIGEAMKSERTLKRIRDMFNRRSAPSALVLGKNLEAITEFNDKLNNVGFSTAQNRANIIMDSMRKKSDLLKSSYGELILSIDDGTGKFSAFAKRMLDTWRATLNLAAGSDIAIKSLNEMNPEIVKAAERWLFWGKVIFYVIGLFVALRIVMMAWAVTLAIVKGVLAVYSIGLGIAVALGWANVLAVKGNVIAIGALRVVTMLATAAQWAWNAAMSANPIGLIIIGIALLSAYMLTLIDHWDTWGASIAMTMGPIGLMLSQIQAIRRNWDDLVNAFSTEGIWSGIKKFGAVMVDAIVMPLQQLYELLSKLPGQWGAAAAQMADDISKFRSETLGVNIPGSEDGKAPILNTEKEKADTLREIVTTNKAVVDFRNIPSGWDVHKNNNGDIDRVTPVIGSSFGR